ncbi:uncharacterized protein DS421_16g533410 [Arachis hypogaea]|nr:uncharacterized protein DS421_16g533410 [Arachis hypogaea]
MKMKTMTTSIVSLLALIMLLNNVFVVLGNRENLLEHKFTNDVNENFERFQNSANLNSFQKEICKFFRKGSGPSHKGKGHSTPPKHKNPPPLDLDFDENFEMFSDLEDSRSFQKQIHEFSTEESGSSGGGEGHKLSPSHEGGGPASSNLYFN